MILRAFYRNLPLQNIHQHVGPYGHLDLRQVDLRLELSIRGLKDTVSDNYEKVDYTYILAHAYLLPVCPTSHTNDSQEGSGPDRTVPNNANTLLAGNRRACKTDENIVDRRAIVLAPLSVPGVLRRR